MLCLTIVELRAYARAKQIVEQTKNLDDLPDDPMIDMVDKIQRDIAKEAQKRKRSKR